VLFFTVNLLERINTLLIDHIDFLRGSVRLCKEKRTFHIDAWVVLLEVEMRSKSRLKRGERGIWQRRFWEHCIRDDRDYENHMDYDHFNPVKHGWVEM